MKKCLRTFLLVSCFVGLLTGCSKQENIDNAETGTKVTNEPIQDVTEDATKEPEQNVTEDVTKEPEQDVTEDATTEPEQDVTEDTTTEPGADVTVEEPDEPATDESTELPAEPSDIEIDMRKLNLSGLYDGDYCLIITDDNKMVFWETYSEEVKTYDITSVEIEKEMVVNKALFDTTYRITGTAKDGGEFIVCTDGRLLRDFNYNEEYGYVHNTFALNHVTAFGETVMELLPAGVTIPTFSDEIEGIELDTDLHAEVCGVYYAPEMESEYEDEAGTHESAFVISEDGYLYEWDDKHAISPDGQWHKYPIVRLEGYEAENYKRIAVETRYKTYEYYYYADTDRATLSGNYVYGFYVVECEKVDELPSNVPALN